MHVITNRTFAENGDEILLLPDDMAFGIGVEVTLERSGDVLTIRPTSSPMTESDSETVEAASTP